MSWVPINIGTRYPQRETFLAGEAARAAARSRLEHAHQFARGDRQNRVTRAVAFGAERTSQKQANVANEPKRTLALELHISVTETVGLTRRVGLIS